MIMIDTFPTDGRHLRRDRNRDAVVSALLELYREGSINPSTEEIAERAGISARSLFRYFDDVDTLVRTAILRQQEHLAPLFTLQVGPTDSFSTRVEGFVDGRVGLIEAMGAVGRVARNLSVAQPRIGAELRRLRRVLRDQVAEVFAEELGVLAEPDAAAALSALDVLTSWESYHLLREDQHLSRAAASTAIANGVRSLLRPPGTS